MTNLRLKLPTAGLADSVMPLFPALYQICWAPPLPGRSQDKSPGCYPGSPIWSRGQDFGFRPNAFGLIPSVGTISEQLI